MKIISYVSIVGTMACTLPLSAQEPTPDRILEPMIVSATRSNQTIEETPYTAYILDRMLLEQSQNRSIPDAFSQVPGVLVQKTTHGHGSPYIRGFTGRQNLLLIDGVRINNSTWRSGPVQYWNTFDQENLDHLEIIKGQGALLYGSDSIGGTVNLVTRSSDFRDKSGKFFHGRSHYRYDTNSQSHVGRLETEFGVGGKWGASLGTSWKDFGDIKDSAVGRMRQTGYTEEAFDFKFEAAVNEDTTITFAHQYFNQDDVWRWHNTVYNPGWRHGNSFATPGSDASRTYDQERSLTYLRIDGALTDHFIETYSATLSYQRVQDSTYRDRSNRGRAVTDQSIDLDTYGADIQFQSTVGPGTLVYGADYYHDSIDSYATSNGRFDPNLRPVADDSKYDLFGAFAQYEWQALENLQITGGMRYSYARAEWEKYRVEGADKDSSGKNSWDDISLSLRGLFDIDDHWSLFGGASQAFRAPNLDDLTGEQFALNGISSSGSVDLDPEEYINYELGVRFINDEITASLAGYYNDIDNPITGVDDRNGGRTAINAGEGYVYGFEGDLQWRFAENWSARLFGAWQDGKIKTPALVGGPESWDTIRRMHPLMGAFSVRWTSPDSKFFIEPRIRAAMRADNLGAGAADDTQRIPINGTPSYVVYSIYSGYQINDHLEITLGLENLLDDDYRFHGSGQNESGFNAVVGVTATW